MSAASLFSRFKASRYYENQTNRHPADLSPGVWTNVPSQTDIPGSGGVDLLTDSLPTGESHLYRIGVRLR